MRKCFLLVFCLAIAFSACTLFSSGDQYAWNYPAAIDSGGVVIQVGRVLIAEKTVFHDDFLKEPYFNDKPVIAEIIFVVKNNSGQTASVYPDQGLVAINGEQIDLFSTPSILGEYVGGEILPGIVKIGGFWFGLRRSALKDIQNMNIIISEPTDIYARSMGPEYHFQIDLSERKNDLIPDELK